MITVPTHRLSDRIAPALPCCPKGGRDAILSEMTNVNGDMFGWMSRSAMLALAMGRTMGCSLGSGRVAN